MATLATAKEIILALINDDKARKKAVILNGPPGVGKTSIFEEIARENNARFIPFLTPTMDPTDVAGIPFPVDGTTQFLPPKDFHSLTPDAPADFQGPTIACFDDMPAGNTAVFNALLRFLHNREVGGQKIRDNVFVCATGNRMEDAANAQYMGTAISNRFIHIDVDNIDEEAWRAWALKNDIAPEVLGYVSHMGLKALHDFKPEENINAFPTPRSVENASRVFKAMGAKRSKLGDSLYIALKGTCGEGWATTFISYLDNTVLCVPAKDIVKDPDNAPVPEEKKIDVFHATISGLSFYIYNNLTTDHVIAGLKYALRIPHPELGIVLAKDICKNIIPKIEDLEQRIEIGNSDVIESINGAFGDLLGG